MNKFKVGTANNKPHNIRYYIIFLHYHHDVTALLRVRVLAL